MKMRNKIIWNKFFTSMISLVFVTNMLLSATLMATAALAEDKRYLGERHRGAHHPRIRIKVTNLDTGMPIKRMDTLMEETSFEVTVINYGADCAGQFVVTALGDPNLGAPPSALVQTVPFIIGPSVDNNSVTGNPLVASIGEPGDFNDWKITASCNGAQPRQRSFAFFEFFVENPY